MSMEELAKVTQSIVEKEAELKKLKDQIDAGNISEAKEIAMRNEKVALQADITKLREKENILLGQQKGNSIYILH